MPMMMMMMMVVPVVMMMTVIRVLQQVQLIKFLEDLEDGLHLSWDDAGQYMQEHNITDDPGPYVDKDQEVYATRIGAHHDGIGLGDQYSKWSAQATIMSASKGVTTQEKIAKRRVYGQKTLFQPMKEKAPDEEEVCTSCTVNL
eukprot:10463713-Karenia_brevis.AAC.1